MEAFANFLSWGAQPGRRARDFVFEREQRDVPPAWWAYALGATTYCPPQGEM